jgi:hypothetical protein
MGVKNSSVNIARNDGIVAWGTIVSVAESPKRAGVLYVGTDDGNVQVTRDGGKAWKNVTETMMDAPQGGFVSEVVPSRFEEGTVYVSFDDHRRNNFGTYVYASSDFGQTWRSITTGLQGEVVRTLTEDPKNADILYAGTETGLFVTLDRGRQWSRLKANLPTVRIDEIVIHPRDNAMVLATHGRAIWILDHLEPIQEYAAAQAAADARLFTLPPSTMYRRPARDRNYEFWGNQTFFGENPPQAAVISWFMKRQASEVKLRITDAVGREVREISGNVLANSTKPGIQSACWDLRVQPFPAADPPAGGGQGAGGGGGGAAGGGGGGGGGRGGQTQTPSPFGAGCSTGGGGFGGGGGGFAFGGGGNPGPWVLPGVYNVALVLDGKTIETKPLRVMADPEVALTELERKKMYDMAMEMHELQRRGTEVSNTIQSLTRQAGEITTALGSRTDVPGDVKTSVEAFTKELSALAPKFTAPQGGRGGRGGAPGADGPVARAVAAKNGLMVGMPVTEQVTRAYNDAKALMPKAMVEANAVFAKATALSTALAKYNLTLTAPAPLKVPTATKPSENR